MPINHGTIVLMGSGELTATMVEVHKSLLGRLGQAAQAAFLDTPAGFQLNADHIARKASAYFRDRVLHPLQIASFKSAGSQNDTLSQHAFTLLRQADYILIGPGSPTYALNQWKQSPIPRILTQRIAEGGCLVAASAAALTIGAQTLPVYEIYKVGTPLHWTAGLNLLGHFGLHLVVIPHWNNAEGGNHDTRYCFMGETRLVELESLLEPPIPILGLDEHTALIIDLAGQKATIEGVGNVTIRWQGRERVFGKTDQLPLSMLQGDFAQTGLVSAASQAISTSPTGGTTQPDGVWEMIHSDADNIRQALDRGDDAQVAGSLLNLERRLWQAQDLLQEHDEMGAAREILRETLSLLAAKMASRPASKKACLVPLVEALLNLRQQFREQKKWNEADALRLCLEQAGIRVEDGPDGPGWDLRSES